MPLPLFGLSRRVDNSSNNPFSTQQRYRPRFSLTALFLLVVVNFAICTILLLASKVPMIAEQLAPFFGTSPSVNETNDRMVHFLFLVVCYSAPLIITGSLSLFYRYAQYRISQQELAEELEEQDSPFG